MIAQTRGAVNAGRRARAAGKPQTPRFGNLCRGRFYIGPVCGAANTRGRDKSLPYGRRRVCSQPGKQRAPTSVGDDARTAPAGAFRRPTGPQGPALRLEIVPGDPAAPQTPAGGINPSPTNHGKRPAKRDSHTPPGGRRAGCPHPAGPAAAQTPAGGPWPSPTNHGKRPTKRDGHTPPGGRRAGCPHPAGPAARRPENRPPRCALPVSPPISSPACHLSRRAV